MLLAAIEATATGGDCHEVVPTSPGHLAKLEFVGISAKVSVEGQRDKMRFHKIGLNLGPGEPPGAI
jgi:hypothetical protein